MWNAETFEHIAHLDKIDICFHICILSHDDKYLFACDYNGVCHIYNTQEKIKVGTVKPTNCGMIYDLACTLDNKFVIFAGEGADLEVLNIETMKLEKVLKGHSSPIPWIAVTPDGRFILSATYNDTIV